VEIVDELKPLRAKVSTILDLELLGTIASKGTTGPQGTALNQTTRITTPQIIEPKLYGRDNVKKDVIDGITSTYQASDLTVLSVVGPGGLGKTTLTQHIYQEVKCRFQVMLWICVSQNFNANRMAQEIVKRIPKVDNEKKNESAEDLIEKRLQSKQFLLVLDDMWTYHEDDWKKLLAHLRKYKQKVTW
jgi:Cdc6-like AAA superfamily ATPase